MSIMPLSEFSGEQDNTSDNRIMRWRERYYRQEAAIATLKAQRDELALSLRKAALDFVNANGTIPSWWKDCVDIVKPILADKIESIANAERPAGC